MCYSDGYKYSDGDMKTFSTGLSIQLAACETSRAIRGGKRKSKKIKRNKRKSKRNKRKSKNIALY